MFLGYNTHAHRDQHYCMQRICGCTLPRRLRGLMSSWYYTFTVHNVCDHDITPSLPLPLSLPSPSLPPLSLHPSLPLSLSLSKVVMGLLDLVVHYNPPDSSQHTSTGTTNKYTRFASEVAHKALNLMILVRPVTMVLTLAKEVAMFLASQHISHAPHSSLQPQQVCICTCSHTSICIHTHIYCVYIYIYIYIFTCTLHSLIIYTYSNTVQI